MHLEFKNNGLRWLLLTVYPAVNIAAAIFMFVEPVNPEHTPYIQSVFTCVYGYQPCSRCTTN